MKDSGRTGREGFGFDFSNIVRKYNGRLEKRDEEIGRGRASGLIAPFLCGIFCNIENLSLTSLARYISPEPRQILLLALNGGDFQLTTR
jgi:hypothetical protein